VIKLVWYKSFTRAFKKTIRKNPELKDKLQEALGIFVSDPFHPILGTHKLSGKLKGHHAFGLGYDLRVVLKFIDHGEVALISIGKHEEVY
jgi:mRNA-degrading endonuclease YafQ of YafQ-DinJ toxin-antitoxin module